MRNFLLITGIVICSLFSFGQLVRIPSAVNSSPAVSKVQKPKVKIQKPNVKVQKPKVVPTKPAAINIPVKTEPDTVYAISFVKQNGWYKPLRRIEKKNADKNIRVLIFTNRNESGNWCRIESVNNYGKPADIELESRIMKIFSESDSKKNKDWIEKIKTITRIDMIPNASGEQVVQERAYDKDGKLVYSFSLSPIDDTGKKFVGSYKDLYGLPAEMRTDENYSYGTLIYVERDCWGNDSLFKHIDSKGYVKPNSEGVFAEIHVYDEYGRRIKQQSADAEGNLTFDGTGKGGFENVYDDQHNRIKTIFMDPTWKPMKLPSNNYELGYIYKYDEYGRLIERINIDENDNPVENALGTNKMIYKFDSYGNISEITGYNLKNELSPVIDNICKEDRKYDHLGNILEEHFIDAEGKPVSYPEYYSTTIISRDYLTGERMSENRYKADENGIELLSYSYIKQGNEAVTTYSDNSKKIEIYDDQNRIKEIRYLDKEGELDYYVDFPLQEYLYDVPLKYLQISNPSLQERINITTSYNSYGKIVERIIENVDNSYQIFATYDEGEIFKIYGLKERNGLLVRLENLNKYGSLARIGKLDGAFSSNITNSLNGEVSGTYGTDEFGEPCYIMEDSLVYYHKIRTSLKNNFYKDENNEEILIHSLMKDRLPKFIMVEVTDSTGYENGFKDSDIILFINNTGINPYSSDLDFRNKKTNLSVETAPIDKEVLVFRIDPKSLTSSCKRINLSKGRIEDFGIKLHYFYATQRQKQRIDSVLNNFELITNIKTDYLNGTHPAVLINTTSRYHSFKEVGEDVVEEEAVNYSWEVNNILSKDAILVGAQLEVSPFLNWRYGDDYSKLTTLVSQTGDILSGIGVIDEEPSLSIFYTFDGINIEKATLKGYPVCFFSESEISEDLHNRLINLKERIEFKEKEPTYKTKAVNLLDEEEKEEIFKHAASLYIYGIYEKAFNLSKELYNADYKDAAEILILCYSRGEGTKQDLKKAEKLALKANDGGNSLCHVAMEYNKKGDIKKAIKLLESVTPQQIYYPQALILLGDIFLTNDTTKAREYYINALNQLNSISNDWDILEIVGRIANLKQYPELKDSAFNIAKNLLEEGGKDKNACYILMTLMNFNYRDAFPYYIQLQINRTNFFDDIDIENFINLYSIALDYYLLYDSTECIYLYAKFLIKEKEYQPALNLLREWKDEGDCQFIMNYELGQIYNNPDYFGHNANQALEAYTKALTKAGYLGEKEVDEIISFCNENFPNHPLTARAKFYLGTEYFRNNRISEALDLFNEAISIEPELKENPEFNTLYNKALERDNDR